MKAIKRNLENLEKVADSILKVPYSEGSFEKYYFDACQNIITLFAAGRDGIGSTIISKIPSNYSFRVSFEDNGLRLSIWFD